MMNNINLIEVMLYTIMLLILGIMLSSKIHPTYMILMLIKLSSIMCLKLTWSAASPMLPIMIFMIMISGILIMFLYFTSLISNEQMTLKINYPLLMLCLMTPTTLHLFENTSLINTEISPINFTNDQSMLNIKMIYEYPFINLSIKCMMYLLISMFTIIKICSIQNMALRKIL